MDMRGWVRAWTPRGVELTHVDAPRAGYVHVASRVSPMRPVRAIVDAATAELRAHARDVRVTSAERVTTVETEHAAIVGLAASASRGAIVRRLGVIFADDFQAIVDATFEAASTSRFVPFVDELVRSFPLLAERRARRCEFTPPAGWAVRSRGLLTHAYAPSFAVDGTLLSVLPAEPPGTRSMLKLLLHEDAIQGMQVTDRAESGLALRSGLSGVLVVVRGMQGGRPIQAQAAILGDARYEYIVRLESRTDLPPEAVLIPVAGSLQPVPSAPAAKGPESLFSFYVD